MWRILRNVLFLTTLFEFCFNILANSESHASPYTAKEISAINQLRPLVEDHLTLDFQRTNAYLLRWVRVSKFDIADAAEALKKNHEWRKKNRIDAILDEPNLRDLPYVVDGVDRSGRPVIILPFGKWILRKHAFSGKPEAVGRQFQRMYETGIRKAFEIADREGKDVDQVYPFTDIQGFALRTHACVACVPIFVDFVRTIAAGTWQFTGNITGVNCPRIFDPLLKIARSIITTVPIYCFDSNKSVWKEELLKHIAPDQLPVYYGGSRRSLKSSHKETLESS